MVFIATINQSYVTLATQTIPVTIVPKACTHSPYSINPLLSPLLFRGRKLMSPPLSFMSPSPSPSPYNPSRINFGVYKFNQDCKPSSGLIPSGMVYSPTGSSDLVLIVGCMTSNFLVLCGKLIPLSLLNWIGPPTLLSSLSNVFEINKPLGA